MFSLLTEIKLSRRQVFLFWILLLLLKIGTVALLIAFQLGVIKKFESLTTNLKNYVANTPFFSSTDAYIDQIESFNVSKDDGGVIRYYKITYRYKTSTKNMSSTCISFGNCVGLERADFSRVVGKDFSHLKRNDSVKVFVSSLNTEISFIFLENVEDVRRNVLIQSTFWGVLFFFAFLLEFLMLRSIPTANRQTKH